VSSPPVFAPFAITRTVVSAMSSNTRVLIPGGDRSVHHDGVNCDFWEYSPRNPIQTKENHESPFRLIFFAIARKFVLAYQILCFQSPWNSRSFTLLSESRQFFEYFELTCGAFLIGITYLPASRHLTIPAADCDNISQY
jgi:hypothetical protein